MTAELELPAHTRLSASGAEKWMECPGSMALGDLLGTDPNAEEPDYSKEGTCAHHFSAMCLLDDSEPWEHIGETAPNGREMDANMAVHLQTYVDAVREISKRPGAKLWVETRIDDPTLHKDFGGTADAIVLWAGRLFVIDLKYGEGIFVDVLDNPQLKYYAFGALRTLKGEDRPEFVHMAIIQPRIDTKSGPVRWMNMSAMEIQQWGLHELLPAMKGTEDDDAPLKPGSWCRFCPAKLVCPVLKGMFHAAAVARPADAEKLSNEQLGLEKEMAAVVKMYIKALDDEAYKRLNSGQAVPGWKLVPKKAERVWKDGAPVIDKFGDEAYKPREMRSPAQIEKLPEGKTFVSEWGYKPLTGYTVAEADDTREAVKVTNPLDKYAKIHHNQPTE